jgi:hypothetical protein
MAKRTSRLYSDASFIAARTPTNRPATAASERRPPPPQLATLSI